MDTKTTKTIEVIPKLGNGAEILQKGNGYIVLEVKRTIKYRPG